MLAASTICAAISFSENCQVPSGDDGRNSPISSVILPIALSVDSTFHLYVGSAFQIVNAGCAVDSIQYLRTIQEVYVVFRQARCGQHQCQIRRWRCMRVSAVAT